MYVSRSVLRSRIFDRKLLHSITLTSTTRFLFVSQLLTILLATFFICMLPLWEETLQTLQTDLRYDGYHIPRS